jgi:hypothetical protein
LLQAQLAAMRGEVSPEMRARIEEATSSAIAAGSADIDEATTEGIGLIADEIANSRGLRLTDTPILREATLLAESGMKQKAGLQRNLRANQMASLVQAPQLASGIGLAQQQLAAQTQGFQAQLRQQAFQNRMALTGGALQSGIGLASIGAGAGASALGSLSGVRAQNRDTQTSGFDPAALLGGWGGFMGGLGRLGALFPSDRRLKEGIRFVGTLPNGIKVYGFKYLGTEEEFIGVTEAVSKDEDGYYLVDYSKLH